MSRVWWEPGRAPEQRPLRSRRLVAVAVLLVLGAGVYAVDALQASPGPLDEQVDSGRFAVSWRPDYDRGWAYLVQAQLASRQPDQLAMAGCRWWADGDGRADVGDRAAFVAGCDQAAVLTHLEGPPWP